MPSYTPVGTETLVNTQTANGQITPRTVALAGGRYMVVWVSEVIVPVTQVNGSIATAYAGADIHAQIFNADGSRAGSEYIINTTTAGAQLRVLTTQLSDGHVLISWHDGVGPAGGSAETTPNTIRAQELDANGVAVGGEFALGNSNGRQHWVAATPTGGFVVTYQEGGVGGSLPAGNIVARIYDASNNQTGNFVIDNTQPIAGNGAMVAVENDGDIIVYWLDRDFTVTNRGATYNPDGTLRSSGALLTGYSIGGVVALAGGGHAFIMQGNIAGQPSTIYAVIASADGSQTQQIEISQVPALVTLPTITALASGGFAVTWTVDSDPGTATNVETMAQIFNASGLPIGEAFQLNTVSTGNQTGASLVQLTTGDIAAAWIDDSLTLGDASGPGIALRMIDYDPTNQVPVVGDITITLFGVAPGQTVIEQPEDINATLGTDADGDQLTLAAVGNVVNGSVTLNPDGTVALVATPGAPGPLSFDYTVTDGNGGFATARATVIMPSDFVTVRPGSVAMVDFLANDYYTPAPGATAFTVTPAGPVMGGSVAGYAGIVYTPTEPRIVYDPLARYDVPGSIDLNSPFFNLLVGQTAEYRSFYFNNQTPGSIDVNFTIEGWAQLGGTGADNLVGTALSDHLSGGTGAANTMAGGAGNDWYTVSAAGDVIIENAGEGTDSVRSALTTLVLADNVENLYFWGALSGTLQGTGNAGNNLIVSQGNAANFSGLGGNDILVGSFSADTLDGGDGNDRLIANGGADTLSGGAGDDRIDLTNNSNSVVNGGDGMDTLYVTGNAGALGGLTGIEAMVFSSASLTLTGTQFNGLSTTASLTGSGSLTVNMTSGSYFFATAMTFSSTISLMVNGTADTDIIKGPLNTAMMINAGDGIDQVRGSNLADIIDAGTGNDKIMGLGGADTLTGGSGADQFRYLFAADSGVGAGADRILDFTIGEDRLDFRGLDANTATPEHDALSFVGTSGFVANGTAQLRYAASGSDTLVQIDLDGNGVADMEILLVGRAGQAMTAADFMF